MQPGVIVHDDAIVLFSFILYISAAVYSQAPKLYLVYIYIYTLGVSYRSFYLYQSSDVLLRRSRPDIYPLSNYPFLYYFLFHLIPIYFFFVLFIIFKSACVINSFESTSWINLIQLIQNQFK